MHQQLSAIFLNIGIAVKSMLFWVFKEPTNVLMVPITTNQQSAFSVCLRTRSLEPGLGHARNPLAASRLETCLQIRQARKLVTRNLKPETMYYEF